MKEQMQFVGGPLDGKKLAVTEGIATVAVPYPEQGTGWHGQIVYERRIIDGKQVMFTEGTVPERKVELVQ